MIPQITQGALAYFLSPSGGVDWMALIVLAVVMLVVGGLIGLLLGSSSRNNYARSRYGKESAAPEAPVLHNARNLTRNYGLMGGGLGLGVGIILILLVYFMGASGPRL